jgi:hypothetical protein
MSGSLTDVCAFHPGAHHLICGLKAKMNEHHSLGGTLTFRSSTIITAAVLWGALNCLGQTNSWNSPTSGHWEGSTWSLGVPPAANQSVLITNAGFKAVGIFQTTATNFPATMTVNNLTISAPSNSQNTLLLNYAGTVVPLNVLSNCTIGTNGSLVNFYSGLQVSGNLTLADTSASFKQEGGLTILTNGSFNVAGLASVSNAVLVLGNIFVEKGSLVQAGGSLDAQELALGGFGGFSLESGLASIQTVYVSGNGYFSPGNIYLSDGVLMSSFVSVFSGGISQTGGSLIVNGRVFVDGHFDTYDPPFVANYMLTGGLVSCEGLSVGDVGFFTQSAGTNCVAGDFGMGFISQYKFSGGVLCTSNSSLNQANDSGSGLNTDFIQSGGVHWVTNSLWGDGYYADYKLTAGTLVASNIILVDDFRLLVGSSPAATISNWGAFKMMGGRLELTNTVQRLGALTSSRVSPYSYSVNSIGFTGTCKVMFADSSGQSWDSTQTLYIEGWNGLATGGGMDQLIFGNSASGLTPAQLQQIRFVGLAGPSATGFAKILPSGEVVPTAVPALTMALLGTNLVVNWPTGNFVLQAATNASGPFMDVAPASPYTNDVTQFPRRFFRLKQ